MTKTSVFIRIALAYCAAATFFAGCNGPQASTIPTGASFSGFNASATRHHQKSGAVGTSSEDFVDLSYGSCSSFTGGCNAEVAVYTFPGGQPIGTWNAAGYALGECADEAGNVFVTYINSGSIGEILKFAHGGTSPVATLSDPTGTPVACSVDPISGDLAVVNGTGTLLIYSNASGIPTTYSLPGVYFYSVSYDNTGNVFVDGLTGYRSSQPVLAKLPKGGNSFKNIKLKGLNSAGELGWDGKHLTLGVPGNPTIIYRLDISGGNGRVAGTTQLTQIHGAVDQYSTEGEHVVVAYSWKPCRAICGDEGTVGIWHYPSGRVIKKHFTPDGAPSTGMALSLAQNHR